MWFVAAIVAFAIALILHLTSVSKGVFLTPFTFELAGFICLSIGWAAPQWPWRRQPTA
jgi:hypothetical protein